MHEQFDDIQLLALIEGELPVVEADAVRAQLQRDPQMSARVEAMIRDRQLLRTEPEPILHLNLLERVEPMLARPMLMDDRPLAEPVVSAPGAFRREHHRRDRRRRIVRFALAASIGIVAFAGLWSVVSLGVAPSMERLAQLFKDENETVHPHDFKPVEPVLIADGVIHHKRPDFQRDLLAGHLGHDFAERRERITDTPHQPRLMLVVQAMDAKQAEQTLERALTGVDERIALVQNFSFAEARELERQWLLARGPVEGTGAPQSADLRGRDRAGNNGPGFDELAERVRQQVREIERQRQPAFSPSRQLLGPRELAASLASQLAYSSRGATHTITLPAGRLHSLLTVLHNATGQRTMLQPLPESAVDAAPARSGERRPPRVAATEVLWLQNMPQIQAALEELERLNPETLVHLPILVLQAP
ncbi:MAG TPA: hypothetical protein PK098_02920 [Phycisphaerales bacterium]|nr:hypothetical protein [Phycisphaerales bacterium]